MNQAVEILVQIFDISFSEHRNVSFLPFSDQTGSQNEKNR